MFRCLFVGDNERILVIRRKRFEEILGPGKHQMWTLAQGFKFERHNVRDIEFTSEWADFIVKERPEVARQFFTQVETTDAQVAVVYLDGKLSRVIGPGKRVLFWIGSASVTFDVIDVREAPEVPAALVEPLARLGARESLMAQVLVEEGKRGLLYLNGRFTREFGPGTYGFWTAVVTPKVDLIETRLQTLEVSGQEILTKDKVTIRVNVSAVFEVLNPVIARASVKDVNEHLYRTLQIAARQTLGKRTLEEALAEKADIDAVVSAEVRQEMEARGVRVTAIALKDIILPGDIRDILNTVVTAEKQAQANLIRRREETAATRSLLNTAKLMEDNPLLVRLKELETLEKVAEKIEKITVVGGLDKLINGTVTLRPE